MKDLETEYEEMPDGITREKKLKKEQAKIEFRKYKLTAFNNEEPLHPRGRHATACIQCPPPEDFEDTGITRMKCARGLCEDCGIKTYSRPDEEKKRTR